MSIRLKIIQIIKRKEKICEGITNGGYILRASLLLTRIELLTKIEMQQFILNCCIFIFMLYIERFLKNFIAKLKIFY